MWPIWRLVSQSNYELGHVIGTWQLRRLRVWFNVWFVIGWDIESQQKDVETVEWEGTMRFTLLLNILNFL